MQRLTEKQWEPIYKTHNPEDWGAYVSDLPESYMALPVLEYVNTKSPNKEVLTVIGLTHYLPVGGYYERIFDTIRDRHIVFENVVSESSGDEGAKDLLPRARSLTESLFRSSANFEGQYSNAFFLDLIQRAKDGVPTVSNGDLSVEEICAIADERGVSFDADIASGSEEGEISEKDRLAILRDCTLSNVLQELTRAKSSGGGVLELVEEAREERMVSTVGDNIDKDTALVIGYRHVNKRLHAGLQDLGFELQSLDFNIIPLPKVLVE